jgi:hypothetical protein
VASPEIGETSDQRISITLILSPTRQLRRRAGAAGCDIF